MKTKQFILVVCVALLPVTLTFAAGLDEKAVLSERIDVHLFGAVIDRSDLEHATTIAAERSCAKRSRAVAVADAAAQHAV